MTNSHCATPIFSSIHDWYFEHMLEQPFMKNNHIFHFWALYSIIIYLQIRFLSKEACSWAILFRKVSFTLQLTMSSLRYFFTLCFSTIFTLVCFVMWKSWLAGFWKQDSTSNTVSNIWQNNFQTRHLVSWKRPDEIWKCIQIYCARTYQQAYFLLDVQGQLIWGEQQEGHSFPILQTQECLSTKFSQFPHYQQCLGPFCEPDQETCSA